MAKRKRKKKNIYLKETTNVAKVGVTSLAGHAVLGGMTGIPGMPAQAGVTANLAGAGLRLATLGQVAKSGLNIVKSFEPDKKKRKSKKKMYGLNLY